MKRIAFLLGFICVASFATFATAAHKTKWHQLESYSFDKYVKEFGKNYSPEEYNNRKQVFEGRLQDIKKHNNDPSKTWKMGVNQLTDRTHEEFKTLLGHRSEINLESKIKRAYQPETPATLEGLPAHWDWRDFGVVSAVKDQGMCGSCWTFATSETVESHWAITTGHLTDLSEQQILDCTPNPNQCGGTGGCQGGTAELAYAQLMQMGGLASEWTYPYVSYFGQNFGCHFNATKTKPLAKLTGYKTLPSNQYTPVMQALATIGPLAVAVDASKWSSYETGVFNGCDYNNVDIDHAVVLVGYGTDAALGDYWLIRNSWSPLWGEEGYIRLKRSANTQCGTDLNPSDGTGCKGGPSQVQVCGTCGILYDVCFPIISAN